MHHWIEPKRVKQTRNQKEATQESSWNRKPSRLIMSMKMWPQALMTWIDTGKRRRETRDERNKKEATRITTKRMSWYVQTLAKKSRLVLAIFSSMVPKPAMPSRINSTTNPKQDKRQNGTSLENEAVKMFHHVEMHKNVMNSGPASRSNRSNVAQTCSAG